ncbi:MAG: hypothetical protein Q9181_007271, partial [Wetmoreana brouardii]
MPSRGGSRGGGRNKSTGNRPPPSREETVSRAMSYVLRHGAEKESLKLDEGGFINCQDLLSWPRLRSLHVTFPELQNIVATNAKQRFFLTPTPSCTSPTSSKPSDYLIRATQGHSLPIASENLLTPLLPDDAEWPEEVVHGTFEDSWKLILKTGGLKRMGRQHVHFALGVPSSSSTTTFSSPKPKPKSHKKGTSKDINDDPDIDIDNDLTLTDPQTPKLEIENGEKIISGMRASANILIWVD